MSKTTEIEGVVGVAQPKPNRNGKKKVRINKKTFWFLEIFPKIQKETVNSRKSC